MCVRHPGVSISIDPERSQDQNLLEYIYVFNASNARSCVDFATKHVTGTLRWLLTSSVSVTKLPLLT